MVVLLLEYLGEFESDLFGNKGGGWGWELFEFGMDQGELGGVERRHWVRESNGFCA